MKIDGVGDGRTVELYTASYTEKLLYILGNNNFAYFLGCTCTPRALGTIGDGAPPQARRHLDLEVYTSGSPLTKFGPM